MVFLSKLNTIKAERCASFNSSGQLAVRNCAAIPQLAVDAPREVEYPRSLGESLLLDKEEWRLGEHKYDCDQEHTRVDRHHDVDRNPVAGQVGHEQQDELARHVDIVVEVRDDGRVSARRDFEHEAVRSGVHDGTCETDHELSACVDCVAARDAETEGCIVSLENL